MAGLELPGVGGSHRAWWWASTFAVLGVEDRCGSTIRVEGRWRGRASPPHAIVGPTCGPAWTAAVSLSGLAGAGRGAARRMAGAALVSTLLLAACADGSSRAAPPGSGPEGSAPAPAADEDPGSSASADPGSTGDATPGATGPPDGAGPGLSPDASESESAGGPNTQATPATVPGPTLAAAPDDGVPRVVVTPTGVVGAVLAVEGHGYRMRTPCGGEATVTGTALGAATIVLDPGHGGDELGAEGPNGLDEKVLNLAVAEATEAILESQGATVVLTRTSDHRMTLGARAAIVRALGPAVFVSIHHNGGADGPSSEPGTETYAQAASPEARRLGGLLYEELFTVFASYDGIDWQGNVDAGAKYRLNGRGGDYYGILRETAGTPAVLSEAAFLANRPEADLLARQDVQQAEAEALARAVTRYLTTDAAGSGFVEPIPRASPGGPGGGADGCVDPPLR